MDPDQDLVSKYLNAVIEAAEKASAVSVILFGSAVSGGFTEAVSDVDLIVVVADGAPRIQLREQIARLESLHGWTHPGRGIDAFFERMTATDRTFFICSRRDLVQADVANILSITAAQALFVDRIVLPGILSGARTVWGEDLLPLIPKTTIRRFDIAKAFFGAGSQLVTSLVIYPFTRKATKYAMGALKHSVHSCYFCFHAKPAPLEHEVAFFGPNQCLDQLLDLRRAYRPSFVFILRAIPTLIRLHLATARKNPFPRSV